MNKQKDDVYYQALDSLKKLNEEILLNKMNEDFTKLLDSLQDEIANFSDDIKGDFALLSGSINMTRDSSENNTKEIIENLQKNSNFFVEKLQNFSNFFQQGVKSIAQKNEQLNNDLLAEINYTIVKYNESFQSINNKHEALTAQFEQKNDQLDSLVKNFSAEILNNKSILESINANWLKSINELIVDLQNQFQKLREQIDGSNNLYNTVKVEILDKVQVLTALNNQTVKQMKLNMDSNEQFKKEIIKEMHGQITKIEQQSATAIEEVLTTILQSATTADVKFQKNMKETEELKAKLANQQVLIEKNVKTNTIFQSVILLGVVVLIVLQFVL